MSAVALRLGIVGCGRIAERGYLPAIAGSVVAEVVALADPVRVRAERLAAACGSQPSVYADARALTGDERVEAMIVASPPAEHLAAATLAAEAGLPCLVEKLPGPDARTARELAKLVPTPWIGFNRRFQQGLELIDEIPARGRLELELELRYRRASWQAHSVRDDAVFDLGSHLVDLALLLAGRRAEVVSAAASPERAEIVLDLERGSARIRCATDRIHRERVIVRAAGAEVAASRSGGLIGATLARIRGGEHPLIGSLRRQVEAFAAAAHGGEPGLLATAADGLRAMELLEVAAAIDSRPARRPGELGRGARRPGQPAAAKDVSR